MKKYGENEKIGLALGGGAVLGAAHIGVLKALEESDIPVSYVAGTSIGALISAFLAFGKGWEEITEVLKDLNWLDISGISLSQFGLLSNKKLGRIIIENMGDVSFDEALIPLAMVATDISTGEKVVLKKGSVATAVMASTCIPGIFVPVEVNGKILVDGGIVENVPVTTLKDMGADLIIGVDLNSKHTFKKPRNIVEVLLRSFDFTLKTATKLQTEQADILVEPDLSSFNMVDVDQMDDLIEKGYQEANLVFHQIR